MNKLTGIALATAVAGLFAGTVASPAFAADGADAKVKCENSSACKGHGACKSAKNACKGQNACKGEGFTMQKSADACKAAQDAAKKAP
ncbi:MAG: hypothetical protein DI564_06235 [Rhodanobacter denitrificans]|uniref:Silver efflux pump n=1 Tax=Rhodanobacter denitrificans TaxID=666685 RepID=A0A2W5KK02_9GAMM|nr:MAG: hypothetical protein DI564_06235 [Rhodanobacter denitrificans]